MWDLKNTGALDALVRVIADPKRRALVEEIIAEFKERVLPKVRERAKAREKRESERERERTRENERDAFAALPPPHVR